MKNFTIYLAAAVMIGLLSTGCLKKADEPPVGCDPAVTAFPFQIIDRITGADLFYGSAAKYRPSELKFFPKNYKSEKDSIPIIRVINYTKQGFIYYPASKARDTILIRIAGMVPDTLTYKLSQPANSCHPLDISDIKFNGTLVTIKESVILAR